jgi:hypothetical protein
MRRSSLRICLLIVGLLAARSVRGETINWYCSPQKVNLTGGGQPMDAGFQFQLGVFASGFIPTAGNASEWAAHWVTAKATSYNPTTKAFEELFTVTGNAAPFSVGARAYVWGRSTSVGNDEWILFRNSSWTWPAPNPSDPFATEWNAASANEVILGSIDSDGSPYLMKSELVYSYPQWRGVQLAGEPSNGPDDDPDGDGVSNALEFVFGTLPMVPGPSSLATTSFIEISGQNYLQLAMPRLRNRLARLTVQVSPDLTQWTSGDAFTAVMEDSAAALVVRDKVAGAARRFMRVKAEVQP